MSRAIRIHEHGGPEVLKLDNVPIPEPGPGQTLIRNKAAGVNFIDLRQRAGRYPLPKLPVTLGMEGAGLAWYTRSRAELIERASELIGMVATGDIVVPVRQQFFLEDAADAHRALEGRSTVGGSILVVK